MRRTISLAVSVLVAGCAWASSAEARSSVEVVGSFVQDAPVITGGDPVTCLQQGAFPCHFEFKATFHFTQCVTQDGACSGVKYGARTLHWDGTGCLKGEGTVYNAQGHTEGSAHQVFEGTASDGTSGTVTIDETFIRYADGSSSATGEITGGSGAWVGSRGSYTADGPLNAGAGYGVYQAHWVRPDTQPAGLLDKGDQSNCREILGS